MSARGGLSTVTFIITAGPPERPETYLVANPLTYRKAQDIRRELERRGWKAQALAIIPA